MRILVTGAALLAMAAGAAAATLKVPQQYPTIQEAVNAAADGDTIKITGGPYRETVDAEARANLKFIGRNVIWDGNVDGLQGACLNGYGGGTVVQGFRFRNGNPCLSLSGGGVTVQKCTFTGAWQWAADLGGDNNRFVKNSVLGCYNGVRIIEGEGPVVEKNTFRRVYGSHVSVSGSMASIRGNVHSGGFDEGTTILVNGADAVVSQNMVRTCDQIMINVNGDNALIQGNWLGNGYAGIYLSGTSGVVDGNRALNFYYYPLDINGGQNTVSGNEAGVSYYSAIDLSGDGHQVLGNRCRDVPDDSGIYSSGTGVVFEGNTIVDVTRGGINANGSDLVVRGNRISGVWSSWGIYVSGGGVHAIEDNVVSESNSGGIYLGGSGSTVSGNTVTGSGSYYNNGIQVSGNTNVVSGNRVDDAGNRGISVSGTGNGVTDCVVTDSALDGFTVAGNDNTLDGCSAMGCGGQGFMNYGANTTVTDSTFLKNALDVANTGTLANGVAGMTFDTGGEAQAQQYYTYE